jgi:phage gpG-like protein
MSLVWFQIDGLADVEDMFERLQAIGGAAFLREFLEGVSLIAERRIAQSFKQGKAPEYVADIGEAWEAAGQAWEPLSEWTIANRRHGGGVNPGRADRILRDMGFLEASIESQFGPDYVEVGTGLFYGEYQHGGTEAHWVAPVEAGALHFFGPGGISIFSKGHKVGPIPARPFVGIDEADLNTIDRLAYRLVQGLM